MTSAWTRGFVLLAALIVMLAPRGADAQALTGQALVSALQGGGYVIVMRHASSPRAEPDAAHADQRNATRERQLDERGRAAATAMGVALRALKIPIGEVLTSPTYRARETVRLAGLAIAKPMAELGDGGRNMQEASGDAGVWLRKKVAERPVGTNTLLVTHYPNMARAFPDSVEGLSDGEALIFHTGQSGVAQLVARVTIDEWPRLEASR